MGALIVISIVAFLLHRNCHSTALKDTDVDDNPVYGHYSEVYQETTIYDTNPCYGAAEMEEVGCCRITDLNSVYGQ